MRCTDDLSIAWMPPDVSILPPSSPGNKLDVCHVIILCHRNALLLNWKQQIDKCAHANSLRQQMHYSLASNLSSAERTHVGILGFCQWAIMYEYFFRHQLSMSIQHICCLSSKNNHTKQNTAVKIALRNVPATFSGVVCPQFSFSKNPPVYTFHQPACAILTSAN